jgi:ELWxxDGT repeat protein
LFFTDGTREGTYGLDINPGYASSDPIVLGQGGDLLYFTATVGDSNNTDTRSIFSTDGTTFTCLADILGSAELLDWTESTAYFQVTDAEHGDELWAANLATGDFGLVKDILPGSGAALAGNQDHFLLGDKLAFTAYTSSTTTGLFITDGTEAGTIQLGSAAPIDRVVLGDTLVYANSGGVYGVDASASDPEAVLLADQALEDVLQSDSDQTVFQTSDGKLYTTDGSSQGTELLLDNVDQFKMVAEDAIYAITCANGNNFLWYSDGTPGGTRFVDELVDDYDYYMDDAVAIKTIGIWDEGVIV